MTSRLRKIIIIGAIICFAGLAGLMVFRLFFVRAVRVATGAMANTIVPGDCLFANRLFGELKRGDIVLFKYPGEPAVSYVSRVVGLPGETIHVQGTAISINDKQIPEQRVYVQYPYNYEVGVLKELSSEGSGPYRVFYWKEHDKLVNTVSPDMKFGVNEPFPIPPREYFLISDNRDNSIDSRVRGPVPLELIWGKPTMVYWSEHPDESRQEKVKWDRIGKTVK
jgi:signal peptidase I